MDKIERRSFSVDSMQIERRDGEPAKIVGHAAVFNQMSEDLGGFREIVLPGAFATAIVKDDIRALFNHNVDKILGRNRSGTLTLKEDDKGLLIEIVPPDTQYARDLMISIDRRDVTQMSFGFSIRPDGASWGQDEHGGSLRTLKSVYVFDVSPVVYPAYPQTEVALRELRAWQEITKKPDDAVYSRNAHLSRLLDLSSL